MNRPSTVTVAVLILVDLVDLGAGEVAEVAVEVVDLEAGVSEGGTGVTVLESSSGVPVGMTVKSFPCSSNNAFGNCLNFSSKRAGSVDLTCL